MDNSSEERNKCMSAEKQGVVAVKKNAWIDGVCEQPSEQIAVVNSEVDGKAMKEGFTFFCFLLRSETKATWLHPHKKASPVLERLCVEKLNDKQKVC